MARDEQDLRLGVPNGSAPHRGRCHPGMRAPRRQSTPKRRPVACRPRLPPPVGMVMGVEDMGRRQPRASAAASTGPPLGGSTWRGAARRVVQQIAVIVGQQEQGRCGREPSPAPMAHSSGIWATSSSCATSASPGTGRAPADRPAAACPLARSRGRRLLGSAMPRPIWGLPRRRLCPSRHAGGAGLPGRPARGSLLADGQLPFPSAASIGFY
jgi:hypothetical protein